MFAIRRKFRFGAFGVIISQSRYIAGIHIVHEYIVQTINI